MLKTDGTEQEIIRWEDGINRICDLELLSAYQDDTQDNQQLCLRDQFDRYTVNFTLYYPLKPNEYMRINGDPVELGSWNKLTGPIIMGQSTQAVKWLTGEMVNPWCHLV